MIEIFADTLVWHGDGKTVADPFTWHDVGDLIDKTRVPHSFAKEHQYYNEQASWRMAEAVSPGWPYYIPQHEWTPEMQRFVAAEQRAQIALWGQAS
jgi:hypothetical protein